MKMPLHHNRPAPPFKTKRARENERKRRLNERIDLWQSMMNANPQGFRQPPTSRKNPKFHTKRAATPMEQMARQLD